MFWLTGPSTAFYSRKQEHSIDELNELHNEIDQKVKNFKFPFYAVDAARNNQDEVYAVVARGIIDQYQTRRNYD